MAALLMFAWGLLADVYKLWPSSKGLHRTLRLSDSKDYSRLALGKSVGLSQMPYRIKTVHDGGKKPKRYIRWVPEGSPTADP